MSYSREKWIGLVGGNIRGLRRSAGLTQVGLGEKSGLNPTAISHFERGARLPDLVSLGKLAEGLGVEVFEILSLRRDKVD